MIQQEAQEISYRIATGWYADCDMETGGVSLGDTMEYDVLRIVGAILFRNQNGAEGDGRSQAGTDG